MKRFIRLQKICFLLLLFSVAVTQLRAADSTAYPRRIYNTQRIHTAPVIDGKLDDKCWNEGEWQSNYTQFMPVYKGKCTYKTAIKILYNDKSVFVAIRAYDDMQQITKRLGRRDNFLGDIVGVQFDSYFDHRTAFEFDITAAGQKLDVWLKNDGWDINWNAVWNAKVAYEDSAWTAEFDIPFSQLRYAATENQVWGLNSWRMVNRLQEENHWNLVANDGTGIVYTFGELHGLSGLKKNRRVELSPYASTGVTTNQKIAGNPFATGHSFHKRLGLDAKIGITNNFTLDATVNPDFGQVEADPSVMNLSAFETYFEEKRPFFTEGKNIFDFSFDGDQLFYSRRIGHPPAYHPPYDTTRVPDFTTIGSAFKLSGKTAKGLSLGIIESFTPSESADIHQDGINSKQKAEPLSNYFIGRFQKDYDKGNTIFGGIVTNTHRIIRDDNLQFLSRNATTWGLDFTRYWKDRMYFFEAKTIGSSIGGENDAISRLQLSSARYLQRPDFKGAGYDSIKTLMNGMGASLKAGKWSKGHWRYNEEIVMRSSGLELNDLGYMNLSNMIRNGTTLGYYERKNTKVFKTYTINLLQQNAWDMQGTHLYSQVSLNALAEFMNNWSAQLITQYKGSAADEWLLRGGPAMRVPGFMSYNWMVMTNNAKKWYFDLMGVHNRGFASNLNYTSLVANVSVRPWSSLLFTLQPNFLKAVDEMQYVGEVNTTGNKKTYLLGRIDNRNLGFAFRIDYALTPEFTVQYYGSPFVSIGKYTHFKKVTDPMAKDFNSRFALLTPALNAGQYAFDENNDGITDYSIANPDFNYQQFRSNLVIRWEYKVGSALFLVWSQDRTAYEPGGAFALNTGFKNMFDHYPRNVFMIKFNYLFKL